MRRGGAGQRWGMAMSVGPMGAQKQSRRGVRSTSSDASPAMSVISVSAMSARGVRRVATNASPSWSLATVHSTQHHKMSLARTLVRSCPGRHCLHPDYILCYADNCSALLVREHRPVKPVTPPSTNWQDHHTGCFRHIAHLPVACGRLCVGIQSWHPTQCAPFQPMTPMPKFYRSLSHSRVRGSRARTEAHVLALLRVQTYGGKTPQTEARILHLQGRGTLVHIVQRHRHAYLVPVRRASVQRLLIPACPRDPSVSSAHNKAVNAVALS